MAVSLDASALSGDFNTIKTWTHTCVAGASHLFVVSSHYSGSGNTGFSNVTYAAVSLTLVKKEDVGNEVEEIWVLSNPASGANTVEVVGGGDQGRGRSLSFLRGILPTGYSAQGTSTSDVLTVNAIAGGATIEGAFVNLSTAITPDSGQTEVDDLDYWFSRRHWSGYTLGALTTAGLSWGGSVAFAHCAVTL